MLEEIPGILRPSAAPRWRKCAKSFALEQQFPETEESPQAREGTAVHFYISEALQGRVLPVGSIAPNGYPIDAGMIERGQIFIDAFNLAKEGSPIIGIESPVAAPRLIHRDNTGTPDAYLLWPEARALTVLDYKDGFREVEPYQNAQLINYAAAVLESHGYDLADIQTFSVTLTIVQPRAFNAYGPVKSWTTSGDTMREAIESLAFAAKLAKSPDAQATTGEHCRYCRAATACTANAQAVTFALDFAGGATAQELSPERLGTELKQIDIALKRLEARKVALEAEAVSALRQGGAVPYWSLGYVNSRERWKAPIEEVVALGDLMGVDLRKDDAVTPSAARKLGLDDAVIAEYAEKPQGAVKLIPLDESAVAKAFGA